MRMMFDQLPTDITAHILDNLNDIKTACQLSATCEALQEACKPHCGRTIACTACDLTVASTSSLRLLSSLVLHQRFDAVVIT